MGVGTKTRIFTENMEEKKEEIKGKGPANDRENARALAEKRLRNHRIRVAAAIIGVIAVLVTVFLVFFAHYDFGKKAWIVKYDPIHGYSYTWYTKQEYTNSRIVINKCLKKGESQTVPDTIWGVRVEELADHSFADSVTSVALGQYVYLVGEGFSNKTITVPYGYDALSTNIAIKDKERSGFYYKILKDSTLIAYAYFGTEDAYQMPSSCAGLKVSKCTKYYVNDDYLSLMAETFATHASTVPFNMGQVKLIMKNAINPYMRYLVNNDSRNNVKNRLYQLPDNYDFLPDGSPANGETAIKMALINNGDGKGNNCAMVMAKYPPLDFISAIQYLSKNTEACLEGNEMNIFEWMQAGFEEIA
ncbi:MAG: hypothetical protein IKG93_12750 [Clostridiales bacterium]|nr:hypothetical protein [Clostridiales bacterium]